MDGSSPETPAKLRINRNAPVGAGPTTPCPHCGADMPKGGVICVACGVDLRTGKQLKSANAATPQKVALLAGGILLLLLLVTLAAILLNGDQDMEATPALIAEVPASPEPSSEPVPDQPDVDVPSEPASDLAENVVPEEEEEFPDEQSVPDSNTEQEVDPDTERDRERFESMRATLRKALDERAPPYIVGDEVELRLETGLVHRGTLVSVRQGVALIVDEDIRERVPIDGLDRPSRLRIDPDVRERLIESRLRQLLNNEEAR